MSIKKVLSVFAMCIVMALGTVTVTELAGVASVAYAQEGKKKTAKEIQRDFKKKFGNSSQLKITQGRANGVVVCKGGGKKCKCDGICVANEYGCTCDSGIKDINIRPGETQTLRGN